MKCARTKIIAKNGSLEQLPSYSLWRQDVESLLAVLPDTALFDLVVTSPPYNIGKAYERSMSLDDYLDWQRRVIAGVVPRIKDTGSLCWQTGNFVENGYIEPLDILMHPIFKDHGLVLRNRIVWTFGHGQHTKRRFSGRYEVVLWYTKGEDYVFNLDAVRIPPKYPGKRAYKGPNKGKLSSHPEGKNPEDVWSIPNVKGNHIEKTVHPCQFPVGLAERLILSLTNPKELVFDPFCGVASAGVAAALHGRKFLGSDCEGEYIKIARKRIDDALAGKAKYRPHDKPIYDHTKSKLSVRPPMSSAP